MVVTDIHVEEIYRKVSIINTGTVFIKGDIHEVLYVYDNFHQDELKFDIMDYDGVSTVIRVKNHYMRNIHELRIGYITKDEYIRANRESKLKEILN